MRPTISQQVGEAIDPATQIIADIAGVNTDDIVSTVPVIRTREMESILKVSNGRTAVLGGLMQDEVNHAKREVPGLAKLPLLGELFFESEQWFFTMDLIDGVPFDQRSPDLPAAGRNTGREPRRRPERISLTSGGQLTTPVISTAYDADKT